jgi:large subunit ribosomal protein L17
MLTSLVLYERIRTTKKRAQVLKPLVDKMITTGKTQRPDVAIRRLNEVITDDNACRKILEVLVKRYEKRPSGYTTIKPVGMRKGDGALLVDMMLVDAQLDAVGCW